MYDRRYTCIGIDSLPIIIGRYSRSIVIMPDCPIFLTRYPAPAFTGTHRRRVFERAADDIATFG